MNREQSRRFAIACLAAGAVVLVDQATKAAALSGLRQDERIPLLGDLLGLQLAFNPGAILSLGAGFTGLLTLLGIGAVILLIVAAARARTGWWAVGIGLILGGAIGNLIDRLFSPPGFGVGHVTDFLAYGTLFIGNLADVALGAGAIVLGLNIWIRHRRARTNTADAGVAGGPSPAAGSAVSGS
ncbi:Lipoprotein signal peptidase [Microbacterium laevaniformans]|uniref:Lipoprotein signal peptidase n=1 Tax=Microbacterium laevaniformans TaxID=36807 RepID=A0A150HIX5_9MICO|nr:signal peptidase II [Microbacterium laevaniformans]KXZ61788.1 Lipoprotein signal peptidase [Microbacterium laevaniformans]